MNQLYYITSEPVESMTDADLDAAATAIERIRALFVGLPSGITLWDAALCKYSRRDPVAIEFMQSHKVAA